MLGVSTPKNKLKTFLNEGSEQAGGTTAPIADLFTDCTVLFAGKLLLEYLALSIPLGPFRTNHVI